MAARRHIVVLNSVENYAGNDDNTICSHYGDREHVKGAIFGNRLTKWAINGEFGQISARPVAAIGRLLTDFR